MKIIPHTTVSETIIIKVINGLKQSQWKHINKRWSGTSSLASLLTWLIMTKNFFYFVLRSKTISTTQLSLGNIWNLWGIIHALSSRRVKKMTVVCWVDTWYVWSSSSHGLADAFHTWILDNFYRIWYLRSQICTSILWRIYPVHLKWRHL